MSVRLGKTNNYTIVMGDFSAQIGKRTNPMETATGKFDLELRNERGDTLVEWATPWKYKIMNTMFRKKAGRRWTWKSPNGETKTEIDYILTHRPDIVTDVTVINHVNIGSDNRLVMSNIKLDVEVERTTLMTKRPPRADATRIGSKKIEFQLELRNHLETLQELDNIDTLSKTISDMIQQSASRVAKAINKSHKSRISSPTRALMTKRREMAGNADNKQRIEYTEICKTIKNITREDIWKYNQEIIREPIMASKSLKKVRRTQMLGAKTDWSHSWTSRVEKSMIKVRS